MRKIYRVSGLKSAGSASTVARAISKIDDSLRVTIDVEHGLIDVQGPVTDYRIAEALEKTGCKYLGPAEQAH
jgi:copper chaperone CopZ